MLEHLFQKYRIGLRDRPKPRALATEDLEVVCYMFLRRQDVGELAIKSPKHTSASFGAQVKQHSCRNHSLD